MLSLPLAAKSSLLEVPAAPLARLEQLRRHTRSKQTHRLLVVAVYERAVAQDAQTPLTPMLAQRLSRRYQGTDRWYTADGPQVL